MVYRAAMKSSQLALASFLGLSSLLGFACGDGGSSDDGSLGDGDGGSSGEGDGDDTSDTCPIGAEGCACTPGGACDEGLDCLSRVCVDASPLTGDGDGDNAPDNNAPGGAGGDGDGDDLEPPTCESNEVLCNESCVDPETDNDYCGATGNCAGERAGQSCEDGHACEDGACRRQCPAAELACDDTCIDPLTESDHCGATGDCTGSDSGEICAEDSECILGSCRAPDGAECTVDDDCVSGTCSTFYQDQDGDGFGALSSGFTKICGSDAPDAGWTTSDLDCCDVAATVEIAALVNPDYDGGPQAVAADGCPDPFDYNCDGEISSDRPVSECGDFGVATCPPTVFDSNAELTCGEMGAILACSGVDSECTQVGGSQTLYTCE